MAEPYSRAQRLLNLTTALRATRAGLDRATIRAQVRGYDPEGDEASFVRMFERDKDLLRAMGLPLETRTDASGNALGYRIPGDWTLPPLDLGAEELAVLAVAARAWESSDLGRAAVNALRKVETRLGVSSASASAGSEQGGMTLSVDALNLDQLHAAVRSTSRVQFEYHRGGAPRPERRDITAWGLVWWRGHWYLVGFDTDRADLRVFRASRIAGGLRVLSEAPAQPRPDGFDARQAVGRFTASRRVRITVELDPGVGTALTRRGEVLDRARDGQVVVAFEADDLARGVAEVLALGAGACVIGPAPAVAEARRQLDAILAAGTIPAAPAGPVRTSQTRASGTAQFSRLLALIPWLAAHSGVSISRAAEHFGISERQLLADLGAAITSGPDDWTLFDIQYWDDEGTIQVIDALTLTTALSLTPEEGFALVIALDALAATPGVDRGLVERTAAKVRAVLGELAPSPGDVGIRVDMPGHVLALVGEARRTGRTLELEYLGEVRDEVTRRTVDPLDIVVVDGVGYLRAHCRLAGASRTFRLDRVLHIGVGTDPAREVQAEPGPASMAAQLARTGTAAIIDAAAHGLHLIDRTPVTRSWELPEAQVRAELPVGDPAWAVRLVLGGAGALVVREPVALAEHVAAVALAARLRLDAVHGSGADSSANAARGVASAVHTVT